MAMYLSKKQKQCQHQKVLRNLVAPKRRETDHARRSGTYSHNSQLAGRIDLFLLNLILAVAICCCRIADGMRHWNAVEADGMSDAK